MLVPVSPTVSPTSPAVGSGFGFGQLTLVRSRHSINKGQDPFANTVPLTPTSQPAARSKRLRRPYFKQTLGPEQILPTYPALRWLAEMPTTMVDLVITVGRIPKKAQKAPMLVKRHNVGLQQSAVGVRVGGVPIVFVCAMWVEAAQ